MSDKLAPAPVLPVVADVCIWFLIKLFFASGNNDNCIAVAKHPGLAIYFAFDILSFWNSGKP